MHSIELTENQLSSEVIENAWYCMLKISNNSINAADI